MNWLAGLGVAALVIALIVSILKLNDRVESWRHASRPKAAPSDSDERWRASNWPQLETRLGGCLPQSLLDLYAQPEVRVAGALRFKDDAGNEHRFDGFLPLDTQMLEENWPEVWADECPFAHAGDGDCYFVKLTASRAPDSRVYIYHHDGDDRELIAENVQEFLGMIGLAV